MLTIEKILGSGNQEIYDYLLQNSRSLLYTNPRFIGLVSEHLDAEPAWFVARRNGKLLGVLPYMVKHGYLGPVFNSLAYYGSNGGVIQHEIDNKSKSCLVDAFFKQALAEKSCSATLITNPLEHDAGFYEKIIKYDFIDQRIGQITKLSGVETDEDLLKRFDDPRPRNIRRAVKEGVIVEKSQCAEAIDFLFYTHEENIRAIGGISKERAFFDLIERHMHAHEWAIYTARLNAEPIAALLLFYFNRTVEYFTPATVDAFRSSQPLALIIYRAMIDAVNQGFTNWNWGGTWISQRGVYDFKKRWGTCDYPYFYYTKIFDQRVVSQSSQFLLDQYKGFFVIPFAHLQQNMD